MQVYDVRDRQPRPDRHAECEQSVQGQILDDGALSPYGVACMHEARAVIEIALGGRSTVLWCAECGTLLGVTQRPVA